jgi:hypothetical protein
VDRLARRDGVAGVDRAEGRALMLALASWIASPDGMAWLASIARKEGR